MATRSPQNNTSSTFLYDALNRVTNVTHNFTGATGTLAYAYDEVGNRKYMQRGNGLTDGFGYDLNSQVTSFRRNGTLTGGTVTGGTLTSLVFDASGNRTSVVENGTTTSYPSANNLNQYPSVGGKGATYDGKGNLYSYDGWTYTYDALYRLTAATGPGVTANFYYDGLNRQVARTITGGTTKFSVWDGWNLYAEYDPNKVQTNRWIRAGNDLIRSPSPEGVYYYPDAAGSTIFLADIYGNLLERYTYDLSGAPSFADAAGTALPGGSNYAVENLFNGQKWYAPLGLYDLRHRFFKPDWGRFLQPDPIGFAGDPANLYRYCANNPVNWTDPTGLLDGGSANTLLPRGYRPSSGASDPAGQIILGTLGVVAAAPVVLLASADSILIPALVALGTPTGQQLVQQASDFVNSYTSAPGANVTLNIQQFGASAGSVASSYETISEWYASLDLPPPADYSSDAAKYPATPSPAPAEDDDRPPQPQPGPPPAPISFGVPSNGFTGSVVGYGGLGPTAGSITGSLLGDLVANSPSYNDAVRKLKQKKGK